MKRGASTWLVVFGLVLIAIAMFVTWVPKGLSTTGAQIILVGATAVGVLALVGLFVARLSTAAGITALAFAVVATIVTAGADHVGPGFVASFGGALIIAIGSLAISSLPRLPASAATEASGPMRDGVKHGDWFIYAASGQLAEVQQWDMGKLVSSRKVVDGKYEPAAPADKS